MSTKHRSCSDNRVSRRRHRPKWKLVMGVAFVLTLAQTQFASVVEGQQPVPAASSTLRVNEPYYYVGCYTERTDLLKETVYSKTPQTCVDICEHQTYSYAVLSGERCFCTNSIIAGERQDDQLCNTRCLANKAEYCGGVGVHSYYSTMLAKELGPNNLKIVNATENSLLLLWEAYEPRRIFIADSGDSEPEPEITNFLIRSHVVHSYSSLPFFPQPEFIVQSTESRFEITDLHPATTYNVTVEAMCGQTVCGSASLIGITAVGEPSPVPAQPKIIESTDTTITVKIPAIRNDNGPVSRVFVIVERVDDALSQSFDSELLGNWQKAQEDGLPYYITAELDYQRPDDANKTRLFVVGDGRLYGKYTNAPLNNTQSHIHISLGVVSSLNGLTKTLYTHSSHEQHSISMDTFTYSTFETGQESVIALTVTCVIFACCLVLSLVTYFYLRYKTCQVRNGNNRNAHEMTLQQPIIERENNGFVVEDELPTVENFKKQLNSLLDSLPPAKRIPRGALRMNVNDILAEGVYGEVISGSLIQGQSTSEANNNECQLHVLALDDLSSEAQIKLLKEFSNLTRLERHENLLDFYGISASADWFYFVFEHQTVSLKRRLIESRRGPGADSGPVQRLSTLSEELVLQWLYEIASAMEYLVSHKVVHKQLCSHSIYITAEAKVKLSLFGPVPFVSNQKKVDTARWLAPEALRYQHFSSKSDIWAFGCVAWECCALGGTPYANITNSQELLAAIKAGARPAQPAFVYQDLYQLLLNCWQLEPSERINFEDIAFNVRQLMTSPRHALSFDRVPVAPGSNTLDPLPYYLPMLEQCN